VNIFVKNTINTTNLNNIVFFSFCRSLYRYITTVYTFCQAEAGNLHIIWKSPIVVFVNMQRSIGKCITCTESYMIPQTMIRQVQKYYGSETIDRVDSSSQLTLLHVHVHLADGSRSNFLREMTPWPPSWMHHVTSKIWLRTMEPWRALPQQEEKNNNNKMKSSNIGSFLI